MGLSDCVVQCAQCRCPQLLFHVPDLAGRAGSAYSTSSAGASAEGEKSLPLYHSPKGTLNVENQALICLLGVPLTVWCGSLLVTGTYLGSHPLPACPKPALWPLWDPLQPDLPLTCPLLYLRILGLHWAPGAPGMTAPDDSRPSSGLHSAPDTGHDCPGGTTSCPHPIKTPLAVCRPIS